MTAAPRTVGMGDGPVPHPGPAELIARNRGTHSFHMWGCEPSPDDVCRDCRAKRWHLSADYACGADVPRETHGARVAREKAERAAAMRRHSRAAAHFWKWCDKRSGVDPAGRPYWLTGHDATGAELTYETLKAEYAARPSRGGAR